MRNKTAAKVSATEKSGSAFHKKIEQFSEPDDVVSCSSQKGRLVLPLHEAISPRFLVAGEVG